MLAIRSKALGPLAALIIVFSAFGPGALSAAFAHSAQLSTEGRALTEVVTEDRGSSDDVEDFHFAGTVEAISENSITINGQSFFFDVNTQLDSGLEVGGEARVEYIIQSDGTFLALEIETDADDDLDADVDGDDDLDADDDGEEIDDDAEDDLREDALEEISDAVEEIAKAEEKIAEAEAKGKEVSLSKETLENAKAQLEKALAAFEEGNYGDAEELAEEAEDLASVARMKYIDKIAVDIADDDDDLQDDDLDNDDDDHDEDDDDNDDDD